MVKLPECQSNQQPHISYSCFSMVDVEVKSNPAKKSTDQSILMNAGNETRCDGVCDGMCRRDHDA